MNRRDVERCLSRFKINEPGTNLKQRVLLKARAAWKESGEVVPAHIHSFKLLRNYACILAGVILLSAINSQVDNWLTNKLLGGRPAVTEYFEEDNGMKDLYVGLGLDYKARKLFISAHQKSESEESVKTLLEQQRQLWKELAIQSQRG